MRRAALPLCLLALAVAACDTAGPSDLGSAGPAASAKPPTEPVCHYDAAAGAYVRLDLVARAAAAHRAHGDGWPGEPVPTMEGHLFDEGCQPVAAATAELEQLSPIQATYETGAFAGSGEGEVTAPVVPVDVNLVGDRSNTSACEAADFAGFPAGGIALVQRGTCNFARKALNAEAAGASAVVIFNQGNTPDREVLIVANATVLEDGTVVSHGIPVVGASFADGVALAQPGSTARVKVGG